MANDARLTFGSHATHVHVCCVVSVVGISSRPTFLGTMKQMSPKSQRSSRVLQSPSDNHKQSSLAGVKAQPVQPTVLRAYVAVVWSCGKTVRRVANVSNHDERRCLSSGHEKSSFLEEGKRDKKKKEREMRRRREEFPTPSVF